MGANTQAGLLLDFTRPQLVVMEVQLRVHVAGMEAGPFKDVMENLYRDVQTARTKIEDDRENVSTRIGG